MKEFIEGFITCIVIMGSCFLCAALVVWNPWTVFITLPTFAWVGYLLIKWDAQKNVE